LKHPYSHYSKLWLGCVIWLELSNTHIATPQQRPDHQDDAAQGTTGSQLKLAEAAVDRRPQDPQNLTRLARLYQASGKFSKALPLLERLVLLNPHDLEAQRLLGIDRFHAGRQREALEPLTAAVQGNPKDDEANFYLGLCDLALDLDAEANKAFDRMAANAPQNVDELYSLVKGYSRLSSAMLSQLSGLDQDSYRMHQVRGEYFDLKNISEQAIQEYERTVQMRPDVASLHYVLGSAYWKQSYLDKAAAEFRRTIELDAQHFMAHYRLGMVLLEQNNPAGAQQEFRAALAKQPGLAYAYLGLGKSLYQQGEYASAVPMLQRFVGLVPDEPPAHYLLYQAFRRLNNPVAAEKQLALFKEKQEKAKAKDPAAITFPEN
jgi:tetratricopeptide (TPR) repeat protein